MVPVIDCRGLIEFCRSFEQHQRSSSNSLSSPTITAAAGKRSKSPSLNVFCEHSPLAFINIAVLFLAIAALAVLTFPSIKFIFSTFVPTSVYLLYYVLSSSPAAAFVAGLVISFTFAGIGLYEFFAYRARKCGNPRCRGLKKAVEFDIQLETEEWVRLLPTDSNDLSAKPLELGKEKKELEAELKKMAPLNGRSVLIFKAPCGCPAGRMEVWGQKKVRRIKK